MYQLILEWTDFGKVFITTCLYLKRNLPLNCNLSTADNWLFRHSSDNKFLSKRKVYLYFVENECIYDNSISNKLIYCLFSFLSIIPNASNAFDFRNCILTLVPFNNVILSFSSK